MSEKKMSPKQQQLGLDIINLKQQLHKVCVDFYHTKYNEGYFNPAEWTGLILSSNLGAMFEELHHIGEIIRKQEGLDLYNKKVLKFQKQISKLSKEMSEVDKCFNRKETH
jgi:hypothetical protein